MNRLIDTIFFCFLTGFVFAQDNDFNYYYIIGDNVNVRIDSTSKDKIAFQLSYGEIVGLSRISKDWYYLDTGYDQGYVSAKYVTGEYFFFKLAQKKLKKNGTTLYSLEKLYLKKGMIEQAIDASIQIINTYKSAIYPTFHEDCTKYNDLAFYTVLKNTKETIDYKSPMVFDYCNKVKKESKDSMVTAWAMGELGRVYFARKEYDLASNMIIKCLRDYDKCLLIPAPCVEYGDDKMAFIKALKTDALQCKGKGNYKNFKMELMNICNSQKATVAAKSVACEVLVRFEQE